MVSPEVKAPPPELIAAPKGAPKAKAAPTPEQYVEWRDNPSQKKVRLMTDAVMILAAKADDKARLDAYLRELRSTKTEEELQRLPMMWAPLPTRSAPARPELTAGLSASSVPPSEPPSEPAGDSLPHLEMLLDDSSTTPDHDHHVSEAGTLPPPSQLMPRPPFMPRPPADSECMYCSTGFRQGFAEQYWEDHLRQQADRGAGPLPDDLPDPSAKTMNAETTSTDQSPPAAIHIDFF